MYDSHISSQLPEKTQKYNEKRNEIELQQSCDFFCGTWERQIIKCLIKYDEYEYKKKIN